MGEKQKDSRRMAKDRKMIAEGWDRKRIAKGKFQNGCQNDSRARILSISLVDIHIRQISRTADIIRFSR